MMREEERRSNFKKTMDDKEGRRRREETTRQIRKNKKEESLRKRRMGANQAENVAIPSTGSVGTDKPKNKTNTINDIPELRRILTSTASTNEEVVEATRGFRRILSVERDPPVDEVLNAGVLPNLVQNLIANPSDVPLIFESAWALTNIASTSRTNVVVDSGAVEPLIQLLRHENADVREQSAWCLGNIAGDNKEFRDHLLQAGVLEPLLMNMQNPANMSLLGNMTWAISNLCRGKPAHDMALVAPAIEPLAALLHKDVSVDVLVDAVWALSYLSDGPNERIERVMQTSVTAKLVEFLEDKTSLLLIPTIRCLGNFVTGSDVQTQVVLDAGILNHLSELLDSPRRTIRKESCWLASNISAGTNQQISLLMRQPGVMQRLVENANQGAWETRKEALWTLSNVCTTGTDNHVMALIQCEGLQPLAEVLSLKNADAIILCAALDAIERVLEVSDRHSNLEYGRIFDEYNGIDYLESLQEHPSDSVYKKTVKIIEAYFGADEEQEDENLAPATTDSGTFGFGISSPKQLFGAATDGPAPVFQFGVSNRAF